MNSKIWNFKFDPRLKYRQVDRQTDKNKEKIFLSLAYYSFGRIIVVTSSRQKKNKLKIQQSQLNVFVYKAYKNLKILVIFTFPWNVKDNDIVV